MPDISKLPKLYFPYLPSILTVAGGVLIATGIFLGKLAAEGELLASWISLGGALVAAIGSLWAGHNQIKSSAANKARDQKIILLSEELRDHATGGDGFCYGYPMMLQGGTHFQWNFIHTGKYPLIDVFVRIHDMRRPFHHGGFNLDLGTLFPGRAHLCSLPGAVDLRTPVQGFNLFFLARNGSWTQEIRWVEMPKVQATANRVIRDGKPLSQPLLLDVSPAYSSPAPLDAVWPAPVGLINIP